MALRDQPYLPLFVQDFLTDEKLAECSASANGVYIRIMCLMHKSEEYGKITLREKEICRSKNGGKQSGKYSGTLQIFAEKLTKHLPYPVEEIEAGLEELLDEGVLFYEDFSICQKRMIKDSEISEKRAASGRRGANSTNQRFINNPNNSSNDKEIANNSFAAAKTAANSEYENEYENTNDIDIKDKKGKGRKGKKDQIAESEVVDADFDAFNNWILTNAPKVGKMETPFSADQYHKIFDEYNDEDIYKTIEAMANYKSLLTKYSSAYLTCRNWLRRDNTRTRAQITIPGSKAGGKIISTLEAINGALIK